MPKSLHLNLHRECFFAAREYRKQSPQLPIIEAIPSAAKDIGLAYRDKCAQSVFIARCETPKRLAIRVRKIQPWNTTSAL